MRVDALLSQFGYCSRREALQWVRRGRVSSEGRILSSPSAQVNPEKTLVDGLPVPFVHGLYVALNKPVGYICSHREEEGSLVDELLPPSWQRRARKVSTVGRLDKETSGLLLLTDDGAFLHALTSPRRHVPKRYRFTTSAPVPGEAVALFASGELTLRGEKDPCRPAELELTAPCSGALTLHEGRYHQARRMLAAVNAPVLTLHRESIGPLSLEALGLAPGQWVEVEPSLFA